MLRVLVRCLDGHLGGFRVGLLVGHRGRGRCQAETRGSQELADCGLQRMSSGCARSQEMHAPRSLPGGIVLLI